MIIIQMCQKISIDYPEIYLTIACGNSTMVHLFLGLIPKHLGLAPFVGFCKDAVMLKGKELDMPVNKNGIILSKPLIGGFVGSDTRAVLLGLHRIRKYG
ncbi:hypothetical protein KR505_11705 [Eubacterium callanderi]|uniref:hypothetical protein n=1 Tax=Eubacterium callanderi TaxID=53442 RepID=UPI001C2DB24C|nr:hypothetical protein [Eubacterium callanderi]